MKFIQCIQPGLLVTGQSDYPVLKPGYAIIKIKRIGICGTDLHAFEGVQPYFSYPRILGHELSGKIVELGAVGAFNIGDRVTIIPYFNCGSCIACLHGKSNCCKHISVCGVHQDGGMVEFLEVPIGALVTGNDLDFDELALVEPFAIGAHGIRRSNLKKNNVALVIGAGPIGLATAAMALAKGAQVMIMDVNQNRLEVAREKLKIDHAILAGGSDDKEMIREINGGDMPEFVFDCTGSLQAINKGFEFMEHGGTYVLIGLQRGEISVNHPEFHKRESTLMSSRNATREDFDFVMKCMKDQIIKPKEFITHRIAFDDLIHSFASLMDPANKVIKAVVEL